MIEVSKENHATILNASLNKLYNQARIKGKLESIDLYIFNILFKYIDECNLELTKAQMTQLTCVYRILYNTSKDICKVNGLTGLRVQQKSKFVVPVKGTPSVNPINNKVYYWQEPTPFTESADIVDAILNDHYLDNKPTTTKALFEFGIDVPLTHIGRIVFAFSSSFASSQFTIKDVLGNNITHAFTKVIIPQTNMVIFVSENVHSFGSIKLIGIEVPGNPNIKIFNPTFNNIFA